MAFFWTNLLIYVRMNIIKNIDKNILHIVILTLKSGNVYIQTIVIISVKIPAIIEISLRSIRSVIL